MGGIAVRAASGYLASDDHYADLAGLVTLGTPHQASPLAGGYATIAEFFNYKPSIPFLKPDNAASECLAWPRPSGCAGVPYLASGEKIATIAGQTNVQYELFDSAVYPASPGDLGDGIVPEESANGYEGSSSGPTPPGTLIGTDQVSCTVTSSQINEWLLNNSDLPAVGGLILNENTLGAAQAGFSPAKAAWFLAVNGMGIPCAHPNLPSNNDVLTLVSKYVHEMAGGDTVPTATPTTQPSNTDSAGPTPSSMAGSGPSWFSLANDVTREITYQGGQYDMQTATIRTTDYPHSEIFRLQGHLATEWQQNWIDYALSGKCTAFETGMGISTKATNPAQRAIFTVFVDGVQKAQTTLGYYDEPQNIHLDVTGASRLRIRLDFPGNNATAAVWGTPTIYCTDNPSPS